ncbi:TetR/AcrR family transcriptional regulator [Streptomyces seoulensis]
MPAARESLLDAAYVALARLPWPAVRMVDVAAAAGVSRQTLYNEFGGKDGLARALVRREAAGFLAGIDRALAGSADPRERLTAAAEWTVAAARGNALVKALLTGCWSDRLPTPAGAAAGGEAGGVAWSAASYLPAVPAQRWPAGPPLSPGGLLAAARDRAAAAVSAPRTAEAVPADVCELVFRLALSCVTAPPGEGGTAALVRGALRHRRPV